MYSVSGSSRSPIKLSVDVKSEEACRAVDKNTGEMCGETEGLRILDEFRKFYEARIERVDQESEVEFDRISLKLQIMKEWIKDLGEQNVMLVHTINDLEQAACSRVKLLEEKLHQSSKIVSDNMGKSNQSEQTLSMLSNRITQLEKDEECLQEKIEFLQSDIRGLLEFIRRAHRENRWSLDGITFLEIQPSDIPISHDCSCVQEQMDTEKVQNLKLQVEELQQTKKDMLEYQTEMEAKLTNLTTKLSIKEESIKKYVSKLQCLSDKLRERSNLINSTTFDSTATNTESDYEIILMADFVENLLIEKDIEIENLQRQLQDNESKLEIITNENNINVRKQLEDKTKELEQIQHEMACLQKESVETREALTAEVAEKHDLVMSLRKEVAALEDQYRHASMQAHFKDDIIKKMRKELKQAAVKDTCSSRKVYIGTDICQKKYPEVHLDTLHCSNKDDETSYNSTNQQQDNILSYLINMKLLMEKEKTTFHDLKIELQKILDKLNIKNKEEYECEMAKVFEKLQSIETLLKNYKLDVLNHYDTGDSIKKCLFSFETQLNCLQIMLQKKCTTYTMDKNEYHLTDVPEKLIKNIECINRMYSEKEKAIIYIDSMIKEYNACHLTDTSNNHCVMTNTNVIQQFKLMEEFRVCTVEAQAATEDIHEEINNVVSIFNTQYEKYIDCNDRTVKVQDELTKMRETILKTINKLELHNEERIRHNERIMNGKMRLKDIKNEINRIQSGFSYFINNIQNNTKVDSTLGYTETYTYNNLMYLVMEEVDQVVANLKAFQTQGCFVMSILQQLKSELSVIECTLKEFQKQINDVVIQNEVTLTTLSEREHRLEKFEGEIDIAHTKMQDVLETLLSIKEGNSTIQYLNYEVNNSEAPNDVLKAKEDLLKLKKEYDDLKFKVLQQTCQTKYDEKINEWKCRIAELQDQVRLLQHEIKCKQETNEFLQQTIESLEKELLSVQIKSENHRRSYTMDNMELKKKILELENVLKTQKEVECNLQTSLNNKELELKMSKELLDSAHTEYKTEGVSLHYGYQIKHENTAQLLKIFQDAIHSAKCDFQNLQSDLKQLMCEESIHSRTTIESAIAKKLKKHEENLNICLQEIDKVKNALYSKDKLLLDMEEIIKIQKNSIIITQAELQELHSKLQEKIDLQCHVIAEHVKEKKELIQQNELQIQTIKHLQDAVVEAKRCLDHMGHKAMSDVSDVWSSVSSSTFNQGNVHDV